MRPFADQGADRRPLEVAGRLIAKRWTLVILWELLDGPHHFGELHRRVAPITPTMLTDRLRGLETAGLIRRAQGPGNPPRTDYALTPVGSTVRPVLVTMHQWAETYLGPTDEGTDRALR